jgi:hypothetical protein
VISLLDRRYGGTAGLDSEDHTGRLLDWFEDDVGITGSATYPGGDFLIPPNPVAGEWRFRLDSPEYRSIKLRSNSRVRTIRGADGAFDPMAKIHRLGRVPHRAAIFENSDQRFGNSGVRLEVLCHGDKQEAARSHGGTYSIDNVGWFCRIMQQPRLLDGQFRYNEGINVSGCEVYDWPGFSFMFHQTKNLLAQRIKIRRSHRDGITLYMSHMAPNISYNEITDGGDDCIALRQVDDFVREVYGEDFFVPPITGAVISNNTLSEKQKMDLPQPEGDRERSANCPINISANVYEPRLAMNTIRYTYNGAETGTIPRPAVNIDFEYGDRYPRGVRISDLVIGDTKAPGVWVRDERITGSLSRAQIKRFTPFNSSAHWSCPWRMPVHWGRANLTPEKVCGP